MKKFLCLVIVMESIHYPAIEDYWSTSWPFASSTFSSIMKRDRFSLVLKFLHLNDNSHYIPKGQPGHDPLYKIRPFLDKILENFQFCFQLGREVSLDESMIGFKGRLGFIQYMPIKPTKWGLKAFVVSDSVTGYAFNWVLYTGKLYTHNCQVLHSQCFSCCLGNDHSQTPSKYGVTHDIVMQVTKSLQGMGHNLYMDNFYTSPAVFHSLQKVGIYSCGTLRCYRIGVPAQIKRSRKMKKGEIISVRKQSVLFLKWKDKGEVSLMTNIHDDSTIVKKRRSKSGVGGYEETVKPTAIEEYNKYMSGVDRLDQFLLYYNFNRRSNKWWRNAFFCLLDIAIYNSFVLYSKSKQDNHKLSFLQYRIQLSRELLMDSSPNSSIPQSCSTVTSPSARLVERHFPDKVPSRQNGKLGQRNCVVCSSKAGRPRKQVHTNVKYVE